MRINEDFEIEVLFNTPTDEAKALMHNGTIAYRKLLGIGRNNINLDKIPIVTEAEYHGYKLVEYKNGSITVRSQEKMVSPAMPILRDLASNLNIPLVNGSENRHNTSTLGNMVVKSARNLTNRT